LIRDIFLQKEELMTKREIVLACLSASDKHYYEPVQIQKIIFLFQEKAAAYLKAKPFNFRPYDYGPFDADIYFCLEELEKEGIVDIIGEPFDRHRLYRLKEKGNDIARSAFDMIPEPYHNFLSRLCAWVHSVSFAQLVGAVYKEFPSMREKSVFVGN